MMDYLKRAQEVIDVEIEGLSQMRNALDASWTAAVDLILRRIEAGGKIVVTGMGKNMHVGQKIAATLTSTGATAVTLHPSEAMHGDLGVVSAHDVLLAISYSGETDELLHLLPVARRIGAAIVCFTADAESQLAERSDVALSIAVPREACPFNMAPTASTTATLALGDALAMVLLDARGFRQEDYAKLHPGGAIGRSLLLRVEDIMRKSDRLPLVRPGTPVREAVEAMTLKKSGAVAVVDENERLLGILTDGDLRRHLFNEISPAAALIEQIMTSVPVTVHQGDLAVEALKLFEEHNIDDLLVVDDEQRVVGIVDIQDLPKLKIF